MYSLGKRVVVKMKIILLSFVILVVANTVYADEQNQDEKWIDYRLVPEYASDEDLSNYDETTASPAPPVVFCTAPGLKCGTDCETLYLCRKMGDEWIYDVLDKCGGTQPHCNVNECSATPSVECALNGIKFPCKSYEGMYPDPGSCKKFNYCIPPPDSQGNLNNHDSECTVGYAYNPKTTYCDIPLRNETCGPSVIPKCNSPGNTGAIKVNPSLYYICGRYQQGSNVLYPFLYLCPNGRTYNEKDYSCNK